jgi:hypothetical protein
VAPAFPTVPIYFPTASQSGRLAYGQVFFCKELDGVFYRVRGGDRPMIGRHPGTLECTFQNDENFDLLPNHGLLLVKTFNMDGWS